MQITWWLGAFIKHRDPTAAAAANAWEARADCSHGGCSRAGWGAYLLNNGTWSSPRGFTFAVDRASALQRSRHWLQAQYRMNKRGVRVMPPSLHDAPRARWLPKPGFDFAPLPWAHVNERLPFALFSASFVERPVPPCVLTGDHATQNCSWNHRAHERASHKLLPTLIAPSASLRPSTALTSWLSSSGSQLLPADVGTPTPHPKGCKAYERSCGTVG